MDGHELYRLGLFAGIHVGEQGSMVQVIAQGNGLPCFPGKIEDGLF